MDPILREAHYRRISFLKRSYKLEWLVEQEIFGHARVEDLDDEPLQALLSLMETARECRQENIPFEDAGLVRRTAP
jgi:hypothetical protein